VTPEGNDAWFYLLVNVSRLPYFKKILQKFSQFYMGGKKILARY
jgi:hypothetical protein